MALSDLSRGEVQEAHVRLAWIASAVVVLSAIPCNAAGLRSRAVAVTLVAHVPARFSLQADTPSSTGATASIVSAGQNGFTIQLSINPGEAALIQIPVVLRTNTNDLVLKASVEGVTSGYIWLEGGEAIAPSIRSRPMPVGANVTFAIASGLFRTSSVGAPLPGAISIAIPPGAVPGDGRAAVQITLEALHP